MPEVSYDITSDILTFGERRFSGEVLRARLGRALTFEADESGVIRAKPERPNTLEHGSIRVDLVRREAFVADVLVPTRHKEFDLLALFLANAGRSLTRRSIATFLWRETPASNSIEQLVSRLRKALRNAPGVFIETVKDVGYRLTERG